MCVDRVPCTSYEATKRAQHESTVCPSHTHDTHAQSLAWLLLSTATWRLAGSYPLPRRMSVMWRHKGVTMYHHCCCAATTRCSSPSSTTDLTCQCCSKQMRRELPLCTHLHQVGVGSVLCCRQGTRRKACTKTAVPFLHCLPSLPTNAGSSCWPPSS